MHDIHWAAIVSNSGYLLVLVLLSFAIVRLMIRGKKTPGPKEIYNGDKVQVTLSATGETRTGTVAGVGSIPDGFTIICK